ncbi:exonuclease mut-7 homolog [Tetranychus urticae]|uniref:3'-5' exonuclease domain-containing protein n=1 Tax=Tetranychus urticae TaxID=32264 RepID=T1JSQ0_TETUR|nr:exonuclease mut-7 homolog [Tetranychus urticae]
MDKDISEITNKWRYLNQGQMKKDTDEKIGPYLDKYFMKYKETIYTSALSLFKALDSRSLRKSYKHEPISIQALKRFKDFMDRNQAMIDETLREEKVILAACQFAIDRESETWINTICKYYHVESLPKADRIRLLQKTLDEKKFSSAAWFGIHAKVIREFNIEDICVPLICQTKINVVEQLMRQDPAIAQDVAACIDKYVDNAGELAYFARDIPGANFVMVNNKSINKLAKRLAREYKIPIQLCPKTDYNAKITAIKFLFKRKYEEHQPMDKRTWETMIDSVFDLDNPALEDSNLVLELIYDLTNYEQYEEARRLAHLHRIPENEWPESLLSNRSKPDKHYPSLDSKSFILDWDAEGVEVEAENFEYDLPEDKIFLIDSHEKFKEMNSYITNKRPLLAIDTEWKPNLGLLTEGKTKVALVQIACEDRIFVVDAVKLSCDSEWATFVNSIINNPTLLKIGFSLQNDMLAISELMADMNIETKPESFIDYAEFHNSLVQAFKIPLPEYPVSTKGLSKLSYTVLGKCLVKEDQYTNWEMRPLTADKIAYAATDAFVLLKIHEKLESWCQERAINYEVLMKALLKKDSTKNKVNVK